MKFNLIALKLARNISYLKLIKKNQIIKSKFWRFLCFSIAFLLASLFCYFLYKVRNFDITSVTCIASVDGSSSLFPYKEILFRFVILAINSKTFFSFSIPSSLVSLTAIKPNSPDVN